MKNAIYRISAICLTAVMLTGCQAAKKESSSETSFKISDNPMLDVSGLERSGTYQRKIDVMYYEINDIYNNAPVCNFDQYKSPDGEIFAFDGEGRLVYYGCKAKVEDNAERMSSDQLTEKCDTVLSVCVENYSDFTQTRSDFSDDSELCTRTMEYRRDDNATGRIFAEINEYGDITSLEIYYNAELTDEEQSCFDEKINEYTAEMKEKFPIEDYDFTVQYHRTEKTLFALYTFDFTETDGTEFCEQIGFTMDQTS